MLKEPRISYIKIPVIGEVGAHEIAVYDWNNSSSKDTVFCVHGLTRNGRDFYVLASTLCQDYRVISIDVVGRGKSSKHQKPEDYNYPNYVSDISHIFKELSLSNVHWIGTSMGGIIGMMVANAFPQFLKTITINDIGCIVPASGLKRILTYVGVTEFANRQEAEKEMRLRCSAYGIASEEHWQHLFRHGIIDMEGGKAKFAYDPNISKTFPPAENLQDIDLWALWEGVKQKPTMLIHGAKSDILTADTAQKMKEAHPNLKLLTIEDAGHAPALMDDYQIKEAKDFLHQSAIS